MSLFNRIETLEKGNFDSWKIQIEAVLIKNDLGNIVIYYVQRPDTEKEAVTWQDLSTTLVVWDTQYLKAN